MKKTKYRYIRILIRWRNWRLSLGDKIVANKNKLTRYEEKAIKLWKILLKNEDTKMSYNTSQVRQIEKQTIFMTFQIGNNNDYIMTLIDVTDNRRNLYELHIPANHAETVIDHFDYELEKRMNRVETNKREIIETDIDKLLLQEEEIILNRNKN